MKPITIYICLFLSISCNAQWKTVPSGTKYPLTEICFADTLTGFIIALEPQFPVPNVLLATTDGGNHWKPVIYNNRIIAVNFLDKDTGAVLCMDTVYITNDGGKKWTTISTKLDPGNLFIMNTSKEWFYVRGQHWGYTRDGGKTWADSTNGNSGLLPIFTRDMQFLNDTTVIGFGGYGPNIFQSNNKGLSWLKPKANIYLPLRFINSGYIADANIWYAAGTGVGRTNKGGICKSEDSGKTWSIVDSNNEGFNCIRSYDPENVYAVGQGGYISKTSDGKTWNKDQSGTSNNLGKIILLPGKAIAIGDSGIILMNDNIARHTAVLPISQNDARIAIYPNPSTNHLIQIRLPEAVYKPANIQVFDVYGRLVLQQNLSGEACTLKLKGQQPGIYFLNIKTEGRSYFSHIILSD
jgi:photosystem II stability/assembly factor-like uncharacterized protein